MPFTKEPIIPHVCQHKRCMNVATHSVMNNNHWVVGDFCEKHADAKIKSLADFDSAIVERRR